MSLFDAAPPLSFENSVFACQIPLPCHLDTASGMVRVDDDCWLVGWSDNLDEGLMRGREGQVAILLFQKDSTQNESATVRCLKRSGVCWSDQQRAWWDTTGKETR